MTILFDLDGTLDRLRGRPLLELRMLRRGAARFAGVIPRHRFHHAFWRAARTMQVHGTSRTNHQVLTTGLALASGRPEPEIAGLLDDMVAGDFTRMGWHFQPMPGAREALLRVRAAGHRVVLATNPVWPERAVRQRLAWGGLGDVPFDLITHSQLMTRCKPDTNYYREVLARLSARPEDCAMIGDNPRKDLPARDVGIRTFLLGRRATWADLDLWLRSAA